MSDDIDRLMRELDQEVGRNARGQTMIDVSRSLPPVPGIHHAISVMEDATGVVRAFVRLPESEAKEWRWKVVHANKRNDGVDYKRDLVVRETNRFGKLIGAFPVDMHPARDVLWQMREADDDDVIQVGDGRTEPDDVDLVILMEVEIVADSVVWLPAESG